MRDQDGRRHADAEDGAEDEKQHEVCIGRGGQRRFTEETADPHGIDRAVERLQHIGAEHRQGKQQKGARDRPTGEVAGPPARGHVVVHGRQLGEGLSESAMIADLTGEVDAASQIPPGVP